MYQQAMNNRERTLRHHGQNHGAGDEHVTTALLHDLGHLLNEQGESPTLRGVDDTHCYFALPFLHGVSAGYYVLCAIQ